MREFLNKSLLFILGVGVISVGIIIYKANSLNPYSLLFLIKNKQIALNAHRPKAIIIGGSNARYGFDSEYLEKKLGLPVVNLAITGHQGSCFYLDWSKRYLNDGDIVIISPEYNLTQPTGLYGDHKLINIGFSGTNLFELLLSNHKILKRQISLLHMIVSQPDFYTKGEIAELITTHNANGDVINCEGKSKDFVPTSITMDNPSNDYFEQVRNYLDYCKQKNVKVFLCYPPVRKETLVTKASPSQVEYLTKVNLPDLNILNTPGSAIYPDSLFYDSSYHLNTTGKNIHTRKISGAIEVYFKEQAIFSSNMNSSSEKNDG